MDVFFVMIPPIKNIQPTINCFGDHVFLAMENTQRDALAALLSQLAAGQSSSSSSNSTGSINTTPTSSRLEAREVVQD